MQTFLRIILWLAFILACFLPASALTPTAPENRVWEIFSTGYDAAPTEAISPDNRIETSTPDYDSAPTHSTITEEIPTAANSSLFGQNAKFKAAEEGVTVYRGVSSVTQEGEANPAFQDALQGVANPRGSILDPVAHNASNEGSAASGFTSWTTDYSTAVDHATQMGDTPGVVLKATVPRSSLTPSPDIFSESEVLRAGPTSGASTTILSP